MSLHFAIIADAKIDVDRVIGKLNDHMNTDSTKSDWFVCHCCNRLHACKPIYNPYVTTRPYCKDCAKSESARDEMTKELADEIPIASLSISKNAVYPVAKPYTSKILQARHPEGGTKNKIDGINKGCGEGKPYSIA